MKLNRILILIGCVILVACTQKKEERKPNIIYILADDMAMAI